MIRDMDSGVHLDCFCDLDARVIPRRGSPPKGRLHLLRRAVVGSLVRAPVLGRSGGGSED